MADDSKTEYSIGSWVRRRRKALDLTQAALAERVGCAEVTIRKIEADTARPSPTIARRLAICLDLPPDERARFLQVARGERSVDRLPPALSRIEAAPRSTDQAPIPVAPIPLDTVPPPAPLPPGSRMPLRRNPLFVGRDADLHKVARALTIGETAAIGQLEIAAATGLGGIGKTQLACEFVHRYGQCFPGGVFWLSFADPTTIPSEVAACGGADAMQLSPAFGTLPLDEQVQRVLAAWKEPLLRLLVFDNCEDEALLDQWRPSHGGCRVLITSRRRHWDVALGVHPLPLDVLPRAESLALLRTFRPDLPAADADLHAIAAALGDLPLALHLAGSFLAKYRHALTPAQYLERLQAPTLLDDRSLQAAGLSPTQHVQHVARTFEQSYARLDPAERTDALALTLLAHAACFAPGEPLPRWLLLQTLDLPDDDPDGALMAEDALTRLIDLGLLDTDAAGNLRMHRLVAAFVQAVLVDGAAQVAVEATMLRVADDLNKRRNPRPLLAVQPHLRFIMEAAQPRSDARSAGLYNALGEHVWQLGAYPEAQGYLEQAIAIRQRVLGIHHPDTAQSLNTLGNVLYYQGQYAHAQGYYEQALGIRQRVLGTDHPETARSLNNLGGVLEAQGQYAQAQGYYEQAFAICQRVLDPDHPLTLLTLNNLGLALYEQGQYAHAQSYLEQALGIRQRVLDADHPDIADSLNNLGEVLKAQERYAAAQSYLEQALGIRQRVLGTRHLSTAQSFNNLGEVLKAQGRYAAAQGYLEQALAICQCVLGADHPDTADSLNNLGEVLKAQGQYAHAQSYLEQALAICQRVLGTDHPHTATVLRGLGELLHARGETAQARRSLEQALAIFEQRLGSQHPDTEQTRRTLAALDAM
ncbi:MAG TPA: FxSxx-COOH system tetratricopeptide repeat protein [Herpetosiphonaceae bacterium]